MVKIIMNCLIFDFYAYYNQPVVYYDMSWHALCTVLRWVPVHTASLLEYWNSFHVR